MAVTTKHLYFNGQRSICGTASILRPEYFIVGWLVLSQLRLVRAKRRAENKVRMPFPSY